MDRRRLDIYRAAVRLADDPAAAASERRQAAAYVAKLQAQYPGIDALAGSAPARAAGAAAGAGQDLWEDLAAFLRGAERVVRTVAAKADLVTKVHRGVTTTIRQAERSGHVTVTIRVDVAAVDALLEASATDRGAVLTAVATNLRRELVEFFTEE